MPNKNGGTRVSEYDVRNCEYDVRNCEYDVRNCKCEKLFGIKLKLDNKLNFENHIIDICIEENFRKIYALVRLAPYFCSLFRGVATGAGGQGCAMVPPHHFPNQTRSKSFSFKHHEYCFLWVFWNYKKLNGFYHECYNFFFFFQRLSFFLTT